MKKRGKALIVLVALVALLALVTSDDVAARLETVGAPRPLVGAVSWAHSSWARLLGPAYPARPDTAVYPTVWPRNAKASPATDVIWSKLDEFAIRAAVNSVPG